IENVAGSASVIASEGSAATSTARASASQPVSRGPRARLQGLTGMQPAREVARDAVCAGTSKDRHRGPRSPHAYAQAGGVPVVQDSYRPYVCHFCVGDVSSAHSIVVMVMASVIVVVPTAVTVVVFA